MNLTNNASLFIYVFGKLYKVLALCKTDAEANEYCQTHPEGAVISETDDGLIVVAARDGFKMDV